LPDSRPGLSGKMTPCRLRALLHGPLHAPRGSLHQITPTGYLVRVSPGRGTPVPDSQPDFDTRGEEIESHKGLLEI
jgi:hypothetical protein